MNDDLLKSIDRTLKAMLGFIISFNIDNPLTLSERIARLHDLGFRPKEISEVVGRTGVYVNKEISHLRKLKKKRSKKND